MTRAAPQRPVRATDAFADRLLAWFDRHGRHDLPWQHPRTPYRVWVSEIMLQQTQVRTVIPYFERFVARFPDVAALAAAPLDDVLALWSGLGYYARARNLHRAAQLCVADHGGELPATAEGLAALPGIGESTANAIFSQAHDVPAPVLDGNVRRVLSRHDAIEGWSGEAAVAEALWRAARQRLPERRGADYTQAIMDLGATVCRRGAPDCAACPVATDCVARATGRTGDLPTPKPRPKVRAVRLELLIARTPDGRVLLERRPPRGIWGGLWSLPEGEDARRAVAARGGAPERPLAPLEHRLTHRVLHIRPSHAAVDECPGTLEYEREHGWFAPAEWRALGLPRPIATLLETLEREIEA